MFKYRSLPLKDRLELLIRESINKSTDLEDCINKLTNRILVLVLEENHFVQRQDRQNAD